MASTPTPLLDNFRPPLSARRHWHAFHNAWATYLASHLNAHLPDGYFAESNVQFGIEIDVATLEEGDGDSAGSTGPQAGRTGLVLAWAPPAPALSVPFAMPAETVEVLVYDGRAGPTLAGAIELVSPANKDWPAHRQAFVSKCETYVQSGAGLVIVDAVTERLANLHDELMARLAPSAAPPSGADLYAGGYRPVERDGQTTLDVWVEALRVGATLPVLPLWLRGGLCVPVDLAATYDRTCREQKVPVAV